MKGLRKNGVKTIFHDNEIFLTYLSDSFANRHEWLYLFSTRHECFTSYVSLTRTRLASCVFVTCGLLLSATLALLLGINTSSAKKPVENLPSWQTSWQTQPRQVCPHLCTPVHSLRFTYSLQFTRFTVNRWFEYSSVGRCLPMFISKVLVSQAYQDNCFFFLQRFASASALCLGCQTGTHSQPVCLFYPCGPQLHANTLNRELHASSGNAACCHYSGL